MIRLHIIAEGQTEKQFVKTVLAEHLANFDVVTDVRFDTLRAEAAQILK